MARRKRRRVEAEPQHDKITNTSSDIVLFNILPLLPVKSVLRFKSVSKQWRSFLTSSMFRKMHLQAHQVINTKNLVVISPRTFKFYTIDCESPEDGFSAGFPLPFKVEPLHRIRILTSVHGLVCVGILKVRRVRNKDWDSANYSDLILWNPEMGEHKTLSKPKPFHEHEDCYTTNESLFGLYHSSWDDDYKLLRVTRHPNVYIYSLKSDSWRKVVSDFQRTRESSLHACLYLSHFWEPSDSWDENLYFFESTVDNTYSIMRFNTKTEKLKVIATPFLGNQRKLTTLLSFNNLRDGCIQLWVNIGNSSSSILSHNELWRMDRDGDWTKVKIFDMIVSHPIKYHHRVHLMRNGNLLMIGDGYVFQQDVKTHTKYFCSYTVDRTPISPGGKYIETMVSPNQYNIKDL